MPRTPRTATQQAIIYFAVFIALGLTTASLGPTLTGLAAQTQVGVGLISLVFTARSVGYMAGSLWSGKLFDRLPGHQVLAGALLLMALTMALTPLTPTLWLLLVVAVPLGWAEGAVDVGGNALMVWSRAGSAGQWLNALHFFFGLGAFLAPLVVARSYALSGGITWSYWFIAACFVPLGVWVWRVPAPQPPAQGASTDAVTGRAHQRLIWLLSAVFFLYVAVEASLGGWIFTYVVTLQPNATTTAAYLTAVFWGALTLGRLLAIPLARLYSPQTIIAGDFVGALVCLIALLWWPDSLPVMWLSIGGLGLFMASVFPSLFAFAERRLSITGRVTSWFVISSSLGAKVSALLIGQLFVLQGPVALPLIAFISLALAALAFIAAARSQSIESTDERR